MKVARHWKRHLRLSAAEGAMSIPLFSYICCCILESVAFYVYLLFAVWKEVDGREREMGTRSLLTHVVLFIAMTCGASSIAFCCDI